MQRPTRRDPIKIKKKHILFIEIGPFKIYFILFYLLKYFLIYVKSVWSSLSKVFCTMTTTPFWDRVPWPRAITWHVKCKNFLKCLMIWLVLIQGTVVPNWGAVTVIKFTTPHNSMSEELEPARHASNVIQWRALHNMPIRTLYIYCAFDDTLGISNQDEN